jgi:hypothetical protein
VIDRVEFILRDNWHKWFLGSPPGDFNFIKLSGNALADGRVILLLVGHDRFPRVIIKIPRSSTQIEITHQEYATLTRLHEMVGEKLRMTLPRPLLYELFDNYCLYLESAVVGKMMGNVRGPWHIGEGLLTRRQVRENVSRALQWLADFQLQTASTSQYLNLMTVEKWAWDTVLNRFPEDTMTEYTERALNVALKRLVEILDGQKVPLSCEHGDFWAGNLFLTNQGVGVIDWADTKFKQPPFYDAFFFVNSYALGFASHFGDPFRMFKSLQQSESWFSELIWSALGRYAQSIGFDLNASRYLIGFALARKAFRDIDHGKIKSRHGHMLELWAQQVLTEIE